MMTLLVRNCCADRRETSRSLRTELCRHVCPPRSGRETSQSIPQRTANVWGPVPKLALPRDSHHGTVAGLGWAGLGWGSNVSRLTDPCSFSFARIGGTGRKGRAQPLLRPRLKRGPSRSTNRGLRDSSSFGERRPAGGFVTAFFFAPHGNATFSFAYPGPGLESGGLGTPQILVSKISPTTGENESGFHHDAALFVGGGIGPATGTLELHVRGEWSRD